MGQTDAAAKEYFSRNDIFADLFNYKLYGGDTVIDPEALSELDTSGLVMPYGENARFPVQRYRDILKVWAAKGDEHAAYVVLGIENQEKVNYGMAVRCALYDAISYAGQISSIQASYERERRRLRKAVKDAEPEANELTEPDVTIEDGNVKIRLTREEFLSGMKETDRLMPVVTVVVHLGVGAWDGPRSLHETLDMPDPRLASFVSDYRMNIICPTEIAKEDFKRFSTDLGFAMDVLAHRTTGADKVVEDTRGRKIDRATAMFLNTAANLKLEYVEQKGDVNMCLAMEKRMQRERVEGAINMGRSLKVPDEKIVELVARDCGVDRAYVRDMMRQMDAGRI